MPHQLIQGCVNDGPWLHRVKVGAVGARRPQREGPFIVRVHHLENSVRFRPKPREMGVNLLDACLSGLF